ncbi:hypothetical protein OAD02_05820, partial [Alphaproteobacteria bacterium]|nr:hypothetical protein [Alphaproteobacteria bacterium]
MIFVDVSKFEETDFDFDFFDIERIIFFTVTKIEKKNFFKGKKVVVLPSVGEKEFENQSFKQLNKASYIFSSLVHDLNIPLLFERSVKWPFGTGLKSIELRALILKCIDIVDKHNPTSVWFYATPHNVSSYVFEFVLRCYNIKVFYLTESPFDWRFRLILVDGNYLKSISSEEKWNSIDKKKYVKLCDRIQRLEPHVLLAKEKKESNNMTFNFSRELFTYWRRPDLILNKFLCFQRYKKLNVKQSFLSLQPYILFALHYQPERSTLPDGQEYVDQLRALYELRSIMPSNINILVKEHPSTFNHTCHWLTRSPRLYNHIDNLPSTYLLPIETDLGPVLKQAIGAASINGSICLESAILRKKGLHFCENRFFEDESPYLSLFNHADPCSFEEVKHAEGEVFNLSLIAERTFSATPNTILSKEDFRKH